MLRTLRKLTCLHAEVRAARNVNVVHGDLNKLTPGLRKFVEGNIRLCQPDNLHICDGTEAENDHIHATLQRDGTFRPLPKFENCWFARSDPRDVARVENVTYMSTAERRDTVPVPIGKVQSKLGNWISPQDCEDEIYDRFPGCMRGRTMYLIPFSMGPVGGRISKIGIELTDSPYVVASMRIMTRMGAPVLKNLTESKSDFIRALHSVGVPIDANGKPIGHDAPRNYMPSWPCNPEKTFIAHIPEMNEICSYGSGYGGNALLGKKCFALRIGSTLAKREGWLAEHMLIVGVTNPKGVKKYIAAAFPSACGKTNFAMLQPTIPGYKVETVGDDIAWMKFDDNGDGRLYGINPEFGFFGVCPGTSHGTNPVAMDTIMKNSIFTNTARTSDGGVYWKGLEKEVLKPGIEVISWKDQPWKNTPTSEPAAHPNSRFTTPAGQCPTIDPDWELERGVPISAFIFGGRRPQGVPLVYQSFNWQHGVFVGAGMRSETTFASAEGAAGKQIINDPFAMRPFFGYNFGHYLQHWLSMQRPDRRARKLPKIFHVNWFRESADGAFLWPGYGENVRVMDWIIRRCDEEPCAETTPIGYVPKLDSFVSKGLEGQVSKDNLRELFRVEKKFWQQEAKTIRDYLETEVNVDLPEPIRQEAIALQKRIDEMP